MVIAFRGLKRLKPYLECTKYYFISGRMGVGSDIATEADEVSHFTHSLVFRNSEKDAPSSELSFDVQK